MRFWTDIINSRGASGWAVADTGEPVVVEARANGRVIGSATTSAYRKDVVDACGGAPGSASAGFNIAFDSRQLVGSEPTLVEVFAGTGEDRELIGKDLVVVPANLEAKLTGKSSAPSGPLPQEISELVQHVFPGSTTTSSEGAAAVCRLLGLRDLRSLRQVSNYIRYLSACWSHFRFVARHFPEVNNSSHDNASKDFFCKVNSAEEMITIAHHLYVLKSFGVEGAFAEFGCFKGFSSSMLSYACSLLGIQMHIYDSFEGLPPSDSGYYRTGDFRGGLDEVKSNIEQFGVIDGVSFHRGFFADSLAREPAPDLMTLWMDVDLFSSAQDVMPAAAKVSPEGAIFSHECVRESFAGDMPKSVRTGPDEVVPAILSHFEQARLVPAGRFVAGHTGAFWRRDRGHPVLGPEEIVAIIRAAGAD